MVKLRYYLLSILIVNLAIAESLNLAAFSQTAPPINQSSQFQSQFSRNLTQNFQAAKSEGCFILYDLQRDRYIRYNSQRCKQRFIPASTFKIFNSLVALEVGAIANIDTVLPWDGKVNSSFPTWNQDQTMRTAFTRSVVWFYQDLARKIGKERMQRYIQAVSYGNQDIADRIGSFWLNGKLRISPEEQIQFLLRLYRDDLPFSQSAIAAVKEIMILESNDRYILRGKTGWAMDVDGVKNTAWHVGYLQKGNDVYFYALNFENQIADFDVISVRKKILYDAFKDLQLIN